MFNFVALGACVGCCSIYADRQLVKQADTHLVDEIKSDIRVNALLTTFGTPLLLEYQQRSAPYDLRIRICDESHSFKLIEVTEIEVAYSDGEVIKKDMLWQRNIHRSNSIGSVDSEMAFDEAIEDVIERHSDATVTLKGRLTKSNGEIVDFSSPATFKARSRFLLVPLLLHGA